MTNRQTIELTPADAGLYTMFDIQSISNVAVVIYIPLKYFKSNLDLLTAQNDVIEFFQSRFEERESSVENPLNLNALNLDGYHLIFSLSDVSNCSIQVRVVAHGAPRMQVRSL